MNELAGQSLGGYLLEEEIGRGSMGMVYRGKQIALGREVAVKVLPRSLAQDPSYVARFTREAQIIAGLNHPNIVHIYDAGQQNGTLYFVMEYVQGPTLSSLLRLDGSMPWHLAAEYAAQIADALDAAYKERHVIHRDIKPENLMLDRWGRIKVMDFGLARAPGLQQITQAQTLVGSIYYASPEQIWSNALDNRSDIYALGVVLYEMVTGQRPFSGRTLPELTRAVVAGRVQLPTMLNPDLEPELERIILTAMAPKRDERYAQASLMAEELRALLLRVPAAGAIYSAQRKGPAVRPGRTESTHRLLPKRSQAKQPNYPPSDLERIYTTPTGELPTNPANSSGQVQQQVSTASLPSHTDWEQTTQVYSPGHEEYATEPQIPAFFTSTEQKPTIEAQADQQPHGPQAPHSFRPLS